MLFTVTFYETNTVAPSWSGVVDSGTTTLTYSEVCNSYGPFSSLWPIFQLIYSYYTSR